MAVHLCLLLMHTCAVMFRRLVFTLSRERKTLYHAQQDENSSSQTQAAGTHSEIFQWLICHVVTIRLQVQLLRLKVPHASVLLIHIFRRRNR